MKLLLDGLALTKAIITDKSLQLKDGEKL